MRAPFARAASCKTAAFRQATSAPIRFSSGSPGSGFNGNSLLARCGLRKLNSVPSSATGLSRLNRSLRLLSSTSSTLPHPVKASARPAGFVVALKSCHCVGLFHSWYSGRSPDRKARAKPHLACHIDDSVRSNLAFRYVHNLKADNHQARIDVHEGTQRKAAFRNGHFCQPDPELGRVWGHWRRHELGNRRLLDVVISAASVTER